MSKICFTFLISLFFIIPINAKQFTSTSFDRFRTQTLDCEDLKYYKYESCRSDDLWFNYTIRSTKNNISPSAINQKLSTNRIDTTIKDCAEKGKQPLVLNFDFGTTSPEKDFIAISEQSLYTNEIGFGLIHENNISSLNTSDSKVKTSNCLISNTPFYFLLDIPEGRYKVTIGLGNPLGNTNTTVKAESRRLMLEGIQPEKGEVIYKEIIVDVRRPKINSDEEIRRKPREMSYNNWDNKLSLEFNGKNPCVYSLQFEEINDVPVIFLAGNSTVVDQEYEPWASWGQMFPRFLKPEIVVANYAESGETLKAFRRENRLKKILSVMKSGDYLFMEFAHNDQKPGGNHVEPFSTYQEELLYFIQEARKKGAFPVLVTSTNRRKFDENGKIVNTLEEYPEAMRQLALQENIPLIDLNAMSKKLYETLGVENSKKAFVHYPANTFPNQDKPLEDNTHFNPYGAYELAKCVVQGIIDNKMKLAEFIIDDFKEFNPENPDNWETFYWPESPATENLKPDGD